MFTELQEDLQKFLMPYGLSIETSIFRDFLSRAIGVSVEGGKGFGINLKYCNNSDDAVSFDVPPMSIEDFKKILAYLELPIETVVINTSLKVSRAVLVEKIVPQFKEAIILESQQGNPPYNQYLVKSKAIIESMAIEQINTAIEKLLSNLNIIEDVDVISRKNKQLSRLLFAIQGPLSEINSTPQYHIYLLRAANKLDSFFKKHPEMRENEKFKLDVDLLYDGLKTYKKYYRAESSIAAINFRKHVNDFLRLHQISAAYCDVVEETLLKMAGITSTPSKSTFDIGADNTRIVFSITDITADEASQWVEFFKSNGDNTATMGRGSKAHANFVPKQQMQGIMSMAQASAFASDSYDGFEKQSYHTTYIRPETHSIEVDAKVLYEIIFPQFKAIIDSWSKDMPFALQGYKEKCCVPMIKAGFTKLYDLLKSKNPAHSLVPVIAQFISNLKDKSAPLLIMQDFKAKIADVMPDGMDFKQSNPEFWPNDACRDQFVSAFVLLSDYCGELDSSVSTHDSVSPISSSSGNRYANFQPVLRADALIKPLTPQ